MHVMSIKIIKKINLTFHCQHVHKVSEDGNRANSRNVVYTEYRQAVAEWNAPSASWMSFGKQWRCRVRCDLLNRNVEYIIALRTGSVTCDWWSFNTQMLVFTKFQLDAVLWYQYKLALSHTESNNTKQNARYRQNPSFRN